MNHSSETLPFALSIGEGSHRVTFAVDDLCRHTMIFGSSGAGKTTRAYNPILQSMLADLGAGAFIIAAKSEAVAEACELARRAGREALVVTPGCEIGLELLTGNPDVDSIYFRDTYGRIGDDALQWIDAAVARMKKRATHVAGRGRTVLYVRTFDVLLFR